MKNVFEGSGEEPSEAVSVFPPFDLRYLRVIELAVRCAWNQLLNDPKEAAQLCAGDEVGISHQLREALNGLRDERTGHVPGYTCDIFERPQLGAEVLTLAHKIRKPDLVFFVVGKRRPGVADSMHDGIFVECKIIDKTKTVADYCNNGLRRFVVGDYSEWMREGMMLAYVRNAQALPNALETLGAQSSHQASLNWDGKLVACTLTSEQPLVYITIHHRGWMYPNSAVSPGPIHVRHLWLPMDCLVDVV